MAEGSSDGPRGPNPSLPAYLRDPDAPQSGWERVRELFQLSEEGQLTQEAEYLVKSSLTGLMVGFVYGGVPAARYTRQQYIKHSQAEIYKHRVEAIRASQNAALRGFIRYGLRWGWRVAAFVTIFNGVSMGLSAYRDKVAMSHFAAAGAVTGGLFRLNLGLRGLFGGSVIGGMLGVPVGMLTSFLQTLAGEDLREQRRKRRRELYEEKLLEWGQQLQFTDAVMEEMQKSEKESAESDLERINELLEQPRNPDHPPEY